MVGVRLGRLDGAEVDVLDGVRLGGLDGVELETSGWVWWTAPIWGWSARGGAAHQRWHPDSRWCASSGNPLLGDPPFLGGGDQGKPFHQCDVFHPH